MLINWWQQLRTLDIPFVWIGYGELLAVTAVLCLLELRSTRQLARLRYSFVVLGTLVALALAAWQWLRDGSFEWGLFTVDRFTLCFAIIVLFLLFISSCQLRGRGTVKQEEPYSLLLLSGLGALGTIHSHDLIGLYLGLELTTLPLIVWLGMCGRYSHEVMIKSYLSSGLASILLLSGVIFIYSGVGDTELSQVFAVAAQTPLGPLKDLGFVLLLAGLATKMGWVPFHFSQADIYEGGEITAVPFLASVTKVVGVLVLVRLVTAGFSPAAFGWSTVLGIAAILAALIGPLQALQQSQLKRRLAYLSLGHLGFLLLGLAAASVRIGMQEMALTATLFYLITYVVMLLGVFASLMAVARRGDEPLEISEYAGLGKTQAGLAAAVSLFWLGLSGLPLLAGFMATFYLLRAVLDAGLTGWVVILLFAWGLSIYGAWDVIKWIYFREPASPKTASRGGPIQQRVATSGYPLLLVLFGCGLLTVYWGIFPSSILLLIRESVRSLLF